MIMTIIAGIAAMIGIYTQYSESKPSIEIKTITSDKLTDLPKVEGLNAQFFYKDSVVKSLWKLNYYIANVGDKIIIGEGNNKNIIKDGIKFYLPDNYKVLELKVKQDNFPFDYSYLNNYIDIKFLQWKPDEAFELTIYIEQLNDSSLPTLKTNEREILNGLIIYSTLHNEIEVNKSLFEYLPKILQSILKWVGLVIFGLTVIIMPIVWISESIKIVKYNKWKKTNYWMYKEWVEESIKDGILELHYEPQELPRRHWNSYPYIKPSIPDNDFGNLTIGVIFIIILTLIPLLIMVKV